MILLHVLRAAELEEVDDDLAAFRVPHPRDHLGPAFREAGVNAKVLVYDHNWDHAEYPAKVLGDPVAAKFAADCTIIRHGSPELVELAEARIAGEEVTMEAVRAAAQPLFDTPDGDRIDTVVLACTHFPLLENELHVAFPHVTYVHGGEGIARRISFLTREQPWPSKPSEGVMLFTGPPRTPSLAALAEFGIGEVKSL